MSVAMLHVLARILMLTAYAGAIGDVFFTNLALRAGAVEANWWMVLIQKQLKDKWVLARLAMSLAGIVGILVKPEYRDSWIGVGAFFAMNVFNWYAVINNVIVISKQKPQG